MASAGSVVIDFAAETAKFQAELKKVRAQLTNLQQTTASISRGFASAGNLFRTAFAGVTLGAGIRAVIRSTSEAETSTAKLENALRSSSAASQLSVARLAAYAQQLQRTTTFSDEAIQDVESLLLSFRGLSGETVLKATAAVANLSARMGTDLQGAALQVGKALSDPLNGLAALGRAGVRFSAQQKEVIKSLLATGQASQAQALILAELEKRFGGAAAAARNTFGGALAGVKNSFDNLLEAKGGMPGATTALNALSETLNSPQTKQGFDSLIAAIAKIVELTAKGTSGLVSLSGSVGDFIARNVTTPGSQFTALQALKLELRDLEARQKALFNNPEGKLERGQDTLRDLAAYNATLRQRIALLEQVDAKQLKALQPVVPTVQKLPEVAQAAGIDVEKQGQLLDIRQRLIRAELEQSFAIIDALEEKERPLREKRQAARIEESKFLTEQTVQEFERYLANEEAKTEATLDAARNRLQIEQQFESEKRSLQQGALDAGIGLLQVLATRSKTAARALILVNRGLMIAQTIQSTAAAAAKALAIYGPTPAGYAAAASAKVYGAVQVGIIAATGALEIGSVNSGNGGSVVGPGTINNPIRTDTTGDAPNNQVRERPVIQFNAFGWSEQAIRDLTDRIREVVGDYDLQLVRNP